ncbi:hypothetical protein Tco_1343593 [Tanacetum coccineum]
MAEPNEYIFVTQKNFLYDDNEGRLVKESFLEIQGTFLVKICDNTFNGIIGENAFKHIDNLLKVVGPLEIKGLSQYRFRLSVFPISLTGATSEWFKKDCIGSVTTWEDLVEKFVQKFYQLSNNNEEMETDEDDDPSDIADIFKIITPHSVMSDSDESGITYTEVSSPFEDLSDIGSPRADDHEYLELPEMPEDPYVEANL